MSQAQETAAMQKANERTAVYFAASIVGLCFILVAAHVESDMKINSSPPGGGVLARNCRKKARYV
jgi:hypothetical protein